MALKIAQHPNLSLNPTKISGTCGRLMCCLKYEQEAYEDLIKHSPKQESFVDTPDGRGTVKEVNLLRQSVKVRMEKQPDTIGCYKNDEICVLRNGKARKNDPPIPDDLAPISGNSVKRRNPDEEESFPVLEDVVIKTALPDEPAAKPTEPKKRRSRSRGKRSGQFRDGAAPKPQAKEPRASSGKQSAPRQDSQPQRKPAPTAEGDAPASKPHRRRRHRKPRPSGDAPKANE